MGAKVYDPLLANVNPFVEFQSIDVTLRCVMNSEYANTAEGEILTRFKTWSEHVRMEKFIRDTYFEVQLSCRVEAIEDFFTHMLPAMASWLGTEGYAIGMMHAAYKETRP